ncbi:MAG: tRNA (uridine(34)/cytosine(34)/5-carboxymethylaminomethyluridine(34)-2'-O)-methyltransferase TrmL [Pseudomonadota bacterium]
MFNIVLFEPEIAPNTGNIIRLCANTGSTLHLIEPLGFKPDDKKLRRAGLDYADWEKVILHDNYEAFLAQSKQERIATLSTHSKQLYTEFSYQAGDYLLFGPETRGLPVNIRESVPKDNQLTLPMVANNRSLNLSNSVAIVVYEAWRQLSFSRAADS